MNQPPIRRVAGYLALSTFVTVIAIGEMHAADTWYAKDTQTQSAHGHWNTIANWVENADGTGNTTSAINSADTYIIDGKTIRTNGTAFNGGLLHIQSGTLDLKAATSTINNDVRVSGTNAHVQQGTSGTATVAINGTLTLDAGSRIRLFNTDTNETRGLNFTANTLVGSGRIYAGFGDFESADTRRAIVTLTITSATGFTGDIQVARASTLRFGNDLVSAGSLTVNDLAFLDLNKNVTFQSVSIGGTALDTGTHTYADLKTRFGDLINDGGSGSITVGPIPEPGSIAALGGLVAAGYVLTARSRK